MRQDSETFTSSLHNSFAQNPVDDQPFHASGGEVGIEELVTLARLMATNAYRNLGLIAVAAALGVPYDGHEVCAIPHEFAHRGGDIRAA